MVDEERVLRLLAGIRRDRQRLQQLETAKSSEAGLDAVKYRFITAIEGVARVAHHCAVSEGWAAPDNNSEAIHELARRGVIDEYLAGRLASATGFRKVLVHQYAIVDDQRVIANLSKLDDLDQFVKQVGRWLSGQKT